MKILLIAERFDGTDGWSRYAVNLRDALVTRDHEAMTEVWGSAIAFLTRPWRWMFLALRIRKRWKRDSFDVLHIAVEPYALATLFLPKKICDQTVLTIHGNYGIRPLRLSLTRHLWPMVLRRIARFITVSAYTKEAVLRELRHIHHEALAKSFDERTTIIHNGIPIIPNLQTFKPSNQKNILHVGGLKPAKGVEEAILGCTAFRKLSKTSFRLTFVGKIWNEQYLNEMRELVRENNLADLVTFRGIVTEKELVELYQSADLLLVPSRTSETTFEGFGLVYLEANSYCIPVIGPNTSGAAEAIKDGVSGYTVDVSNVEQIAERIRWILEEGKIDPAACRKWAKEHDIHRVAENVETVYASIRSCRKLCRRPL